MASSTSSTSSILGQNGTSNFMAGLASGLDTEDMVEKLLSGTQSKIDKQNAKKQQIEWKQDIYRDMITKINGFTDKYFSYLGTGSTNLLSSGFYNVMSASSTNSAVKVMSATSKAQSSMVINSIKQLATATKGESADRVTGALKGTVTAGSFSPDETYSFDMSLDGVRKTIKFQGAGTKEALINNINKSMAKVYGDTVKFDADMNLEFKKIKVPDPDGTADPVTGELPLKEVDDTSHRVILYNNADASDEQVVRDGVLEKLGFKSGASNKLDYNTYLNDVPFASKVQGKSFTFKINGTEIKASSEDTLGDVINRINKSEAGVKVTYSTVKDKFIIEAANTGDNIDITMEQTEGNLLTAMFGIEGGDTASGTFKGLLFTKSTVAEGTVNTTALEELRKSAESKAQKFSFYLSDTDGNEKQYTISISKKAYATDAELIDEINNKLKEKFGTVVDAADETKEVQVLELKLDTAGKASLTAVQLDGDGKAVDPSAVTPAKGYKVRFSADNEDATLSGALGFTKYDGNTELSRLGLSGSIRIKNGTAERTINLDTLSNINELAAALSNGSQRTASFDAASNKISITGGLDTAEIFGVDEAGKSAFNAIFGTASLHKENIGQKFEVEEKDKGQNAVFTVNGTTIERNTNSFELDGITMELTATTSAGDPPINLTTSKDTDKIVEGLKSFVDDYNALIEELNDQVNAEASFQKYPPLTDAQKKEMSEREIENWEEKAKEGLLRNDSNISKFLQEMRTAMYQTVDSAGLALYDIGIEASSNYKDNGKLVLDESKLKSALTTKLDDIQEMFTNKDNGLAVQLQNALKEAANPSSGSPGSLVRYAGTKDVMVTSNTLYYEMKSVKETLSRLNTKYETERTRYWKQFTAMEQAISKMNSQSSWLTQQFS